MLWAALLANSDKTPPSEVLHGLAIWALQFTPQVARIDDAVAMELEASLQLFGGGRALRERILQESRELGATALAWAPTSLAAIALARAGKENGLRAELSEILDPLPLQTLSATQAHETTLIQIGCRTLGDLRRLPRGGITRRFGHDLLQALDQAYGLRPSPHPWITVPDRFVARLELMARVETAPALLFGGRRLLLQMCGWLAARHSGATAITLGWTHDSMRSSNAGASDSITVRTAQPSRDVEHFCRLLAEHLAKRPLSAPAAELELEALDVRRIEHRTPSLIPDAEHQAESLALVLERVAARLGPQRVLRPILVDDHRLEWMQHWQADPATAARRRAPTPPLPQPTFTLKTPLRLAVHDNRPLYQGPLQLLAGPHRIESGWWHRTTDSVAAATHLVARDYWVALSAHAGVLWIFRERRAGNEAAWYLHGTFA